uniref:Zinc finger protein 469 n=1 Tax=Pogona vitticeps TaxID=103695 RepID=A0ABM5ETQ3_9SAUR
MMGETHHDFTTSDIEAGVPNKDRSFKPFGKKDVGELGGSFLDSLESGSPQSRTENGLSAVGVKDKEPHNQREAVIRPQQAGKIDFKSLHNRPKFLSDGPWGAVQGSPQSPPGKSRAREKTRRPGKGERAGPQQLYRLAISSARPSPTIGIAYPQQKVTPPKKADVTQGGGVSGRFHFHVPEREAELQQEDRGFARGFPEAASTHLSGNYTSSIATPRVTHAAKIQPPLSLPHESPSPNRPLHYLDNGSHAWPSPDRSLPGANSNGLLAPKPCPFPESGKPSAHSLAALSFHCPFQPTPSPATDPFPGDDAAADYVDLPLASGQASHGAFAFHSSSRDWKEDALALGSCNGLALESRACGLPSLPPSFLPSQAPGPLPGYKGRKEHPTDHNGAISPLGAMDQNSSTFQENPALFPAGFQVSSKRPPSLKEGIASQRTLDPGNALWRAVPPIPLPQVHFQNKACSDPPAGGLPPSSVPFEKTLPSVAQAHGRLLQPWEGSRKPHAPVEEGATAYLSPLGSQQPFGGPSGLESWQHMKKSWPHLQLASVLAGQSRIELPRKLAGQKLPFLLEASEWEGSGKAQKSPAGYAGGKAPLAGEGALTQRQDPDPQPCSSAHAFCFEGAKEAESPRAGTPRASKARFFGLPADSHLPSIPAFTVPPSALTTSPDESPVPSPALNPPSSSTCSSLSPTSSSPSRLEDGAPLNTPTFFHHPCHPKSSHKPFQASESLSSGAAQCPAADPVQALLLTQGTPKQELLHRALPAKGHIHEPCPEASKGGLESLEAELPPPPYSSHHFLASSLSSASLDQLDVFLTCKQCDHNFSNLSSFLEHRQFCSSHLVLQSQAKEAPHGTECRRQPPASPAPGKQAPGVPGLLLPLEPHSQLMALSKVSDFLVDEGEPKDDSLRANSLSGPATNPLPLSASDLEIDDAKLDSLITEALNGLGYQSDNPEIDSSFIDVFADEELASVKVTSGGMPYKPKEDLPSGKKTKHTDTEENVRTLSCYNNHPGRDLSKDKASGKQRGPKERGMSWLPVHGEGSLETPSSTELSQSQGVGPKMLGGEPRDSGAQAKGGQREGRSSTLLHRKQGAKVTPAPKQPKSSVSLPVNRLRSTSRSMAAKGNIKDTKKQKLRSGTWSKELIHKIVQQKNKLHQLQTKGGEVTSFSLLADRLVPEMKDSKFGEYEYISESDDERVEYAKRHCRRRLGSRLNGRLRSSFGRRRPGRGGREKEKEPPWRFGPRRSLGGEEPPRAAGKEPRRKEERLARGAWRRSSRSSASSCQSTSISSETSASSPTSTERADSDTEKESEPRKRLLPRSSEQAWPLARERQVILGKETAGSRPAKPHPVGFKASRRESLNVARVPYAHEDGAWLHAEEKPLHTKGALDNGPSAPLGPKESAEYGKGCPRDGCRAEAAALETDPGGQAAKRHAQPFPSYHGETSKCQEEEQTDSPSFGPHGLPSDGSASYRQADTKDLRKPAEFMAPVGSFSNTPVGARIAGKGLVAPVDVAGMFSDCKGLSDRCEPSSLFSGAVSMEPSPSASFYLCQGDLEASSFKEKPHQTVPYRAENEQGAVSAPLGFDSSSVFGELPSPAFDDALYEGAASSKASYVPFECPGHQLGKMAPFEPHYSSFLHEKGWGLMEEGSPILPDDLSQFHSLPEDKPEAKRYLDAHGPKRVADYSVPSFLSAMSEDELEIKRLVTELENQLQTGKLHMEEGPGEHPIIPKPHTERTEDPQQFLPLTLDRESDGKGLFLTETGFEAGNLLSTNPYSCDHLDPENGSHQDPWPCSVPFSPLEATLHPPSASGLMLADPFSAKGDPEKLYETLKDAELSGDVDFSGMRNDPPGTVADSCLPDLSIGVASYAEHLMQSPDPLLLKTLEPPELPTHRASPSTADAFLEFPPTEKILEEAEGLGLYHRPAPCLKPGCGQGDVTGQEASEGHVLSGIPSPVCPEEKEFPESRSPERLASATTLQSGPEGPGLLEVQPGDSQAVSQSPAAHGTAGGGAAVPIESLAYSEEAKYQSDLEEKAADPLQQLQLLVARTAEHNGEDLLLPRFPVVLPAPHLHRKPGVDPGWEKEPAGAVPGEGEEVSNNPALEQRRALLAEEETDRATQASDPTKQVLEPEKPSEQLREQVSSCVAGRALLRSPERHNAMAEGRQRQPRKEGCSKEGGRHIPPGDVSPECSPLATHSNSGTILSPREEEGPPAGQVKGESEESPEKVALAFQSERKSPVSRVSPENETPGGAPATLLKARLPCRAPWGDACPEGQALETKETHRDEKNGVQTGQLRPGLSLAPSLPPSEDRYLPQGTEFRLGTGPVLAQENSLEKKQAGCCGEASPDGLPLNVDVAEQKDSSQEEDPGRVAGSDFGVPPAEETRCLNAAEGQASPLLACEGSPRAGKGTPGNTRSTPSEHKEQKGAPQFSPIPSPLTSEVTASGQECGAKEVAQDLAGPQTSPFSVACCSGDLATPLVGTGPLRELQGDSSRPLHVPPFGNKDPSDLEEPPKPLDDEESSRCSERGTVTRPAPVSRQNIFPGRSPSEADSALLTDGRAGQNVEFSPKNLAGEGNKNCPHHPTQTEVLSRDAHVPAMPRANFTGVANAGGDQPGRNHFPERAKNGLEGALRGVDCGGPDLEKKNSEGKEDGEGLPSCTGLEESKRESPREASKTGRQLARRRRGLPSVCDLCFIPFKSKVGLMRHKAVKHLKKNVDPSLQEPAFAPPEQTLEPSKRLSRKNRKALVTKEEASSSRVPKAASGRPFPKPCRGQRREPSREIQEVVSKVLGNLRVVSSAISHKLKRIDSPSKEIKTKPRSSWADGSEGLASSRSPKKATTGGKGREAGAKESGSFAGRKLKGKARKGKGKGSSNQKEATGSSQETEVPSVHSDGTRDPLDLFPTPATKGQGSSSWLPCPLTFKGPEGAAGRRPSTDGAPAQEEVLHDAESGPEPEGEPGGKGRWTPRDEGPRASRDAGEEGASRACEEQEGHKAVEGPRPTKGRDSEERKGTAPPNSLPGPSAAQASQHLGKGLPDVASGEATEAARPSPGEAESWRMEDLSPKAESRGSGGTAPDLQSLLDDDATFSQLFPRNDRFARRKCTRVYGKRAKKLLRAAAEWKSKPEGGTADPFTIRMASDLGDTGSLCVTREDLCEYDTISLNDTLMLNMCHGSSAGVSEVSSRSADGLALRPDAGPREDGRDVEAAGQLSFLEQKNPARSLPGFSRWSSPERKAEDVPVAEASLSPRQELAVEGSAADTSPEPPDLGEEARMEGSRPSPAFHTIDMEMLEAKFEMRDLCLCGGGDGEGPLSQAGDDGAHAFAFQPPPALPSRPAKSQLEEGKPSKARSDPTLKAKDKQYKCKVCFQWFRTLGELDFHKLSHSPSPPPTCYMCVQRRFSSREQLRDHLEAKHAKSKAGLWACGMCLKEISGVGMYNEHLREHATQFARKGQAQKSLLALPGCFGEDAAAVTSFLNSIIYRKPSKASRQAEAGSRGPAGPERKGPREPPGQEGALGQGGPPGALERTPPPPPAPSPSPPSPDPALKAEGAQKLAHPVHPECKDPSRDCHHCGKQFPKPFKLQRHLVVHSFQKIYLCPRCPMFYQETQELRRHLSQEHPAAEAPEVKHTTLYACELCADVMHVIKKSFICSACNYTFSKKEQYDRHMEKHRAGSRRTFRFRGVMRPRGGAWAKEGGPAAPGEAPLGEGRPATQRRKVAPRPGLPVPPADSEGVQAATPLEGDLPSSPGRPRPPVANGIPEDPPQSSVRTKVSGASSSSLSAEGPEAPLGHHPPPPPPPPATLLVAPNGEARGLDVGCVETGQPSEGRFLAGPLPPFLDPPDAGAGVDLASSAATERAAGAAASTAHPPEELGAPGKAPESGHADPALGTWLSLYSEEDPVSKKAGTEATEGKTQGSTDPHPDETQPQEDAPKPHLREAPFRGVPPLKDKRASPALSRLAKEIPFKKSTGGHGPSEGALGVPGSLDRGEGAQNPPCPKDKPPPALGGTDVANQEPGSHPIKPAGGPFRSEAGGTPAKHHASDPSRCPERPVAGGQAKLHPAKRKEHKSSHKGSPASQENLEEDGSRKKKARTQEPVRNDGPRGYRRADWASGDGLALSPRRRDSPCPKPTPKLKVPLPASQLRRLLPDPGFPKKGEGRPHAPGDGKPRRRGLLGSKAALHPLGAKDPSLSLPGSSNRPRALQGAKLPDAAHNYRTAESQNNLLSQLFGQKLTSFKIPLRRDTSE